MGETGDIFVVTGVTGTMNSTVKANQSQEIGVICTSCTEQTSAYLGERCLSDRKTGRVRGWAAKRTSSQSFARMTDPATGGFNATLFELTVDARQLTSGSTYKLCVDNDGPKLESRRDHGPYFERG